MSRRAQRLVLVALLFAALPASADLDGEVHDDGEIWSHALWNLRTALGHTHANTAILLTHIGQDNPTMPSLATDIVRTVRSLYGNGAANQAFGAFHDRGII